MRVIRKTQNRMICSRLRILKFRCIHTTATYIHNSAIIHSTPSLCNEILPGPSSACQCWHLIVTSGGSVPVSLDTYLKVTSHQSQSSLHWFFNWFVSSGCQRRAHDQASTTGNIIRFNSTHTVNIHRNGVFIFTLTSQYAFASLVSKYLLHNEIVERNISQL